MYLIIKCQILLQNNKDFLALINSFVHILAVALIGEWEKPVIPIFLKDKFRFIPGNCFLALNIFSAGLQRTDIFLFTFI